MVLFESDTKYALEAQSGDDGVTQTCVSQQTVVHFVLLGLLLLFTFTFARWFNVGLKSIGHCSQMPSCP